MFEMVSHSETAQAKLTPLQESTPPYSPIFVNPAGVMQLLTADRYQPFLEARVQAERYFDTQQAQGVGVLDNEGRLVAWRYHRSKLYQAALKKPKE